MLSAVELTLMANRLVLHATHYQESTFYFILFYKISHREIGYQNNINITQ